MKFINSVKNQIKYGELTPLSYPKEMYMTFLDSKSAEKWGKSVYSDWAQTYKTITYRIKCIRPETSSTVNKSLEHYCGYQYKELNSYLRGNNNIDPIYKESADLLIYTLASAPLVPNNIIVYRLVGNDFIDKLVSNNKKGIPTIEEGFMSTSLTMDIVNNDDSYTNHNNLLKIYVPKDVVGVYVNTITFRSEYELLLAPNYFLRLVEYPYFDPKARKTVYECELLNTRVIV